MRLINKSNVPEERVFQVARIAAVEQYDFVALLDSAVNSVKADSAKLKLAEYRNKGWKPLPSWETDATGESDIHACTVHHAIIRNQLLPQHVKDAIVGFDLLVYVDGTWTAGDAIDFVLTFAHELRHAWQFYNLPIVFFSQTPLAWVMQPQSTPSEADAEKNGKAIAEIIFGREAVSAHLAAELATCRPEHREVLARLKESETQALPSEILESETLHLLNEHASEIRTVQLKNGFQIPGIRELIEHAREKLAISLLP